MVMNLLNCARREGTTKKKWQLEFSTLNGILFTSFLKGGEPFEVVIEPHTNI